MDKHSKMNEFPPEFRDDLVSKDMELAYLRAEIAANLRAEIIAQVKNCVSHRFNIRIDLESKNVSYRTIMTLHEELSERRFTIHYEINYTEGPFSLVKRITFSEIDPYGKMPIAMILGCEQNM